MTLEKDSKLIGNFKAGKVIGTGTFGKVRQATHLPTGQKVAIKILQKKKIKTPKDLERIQKQLQILKGLNHPNILKLLEVNETEHCIFIVTELARGEELYDHIVRKTTLSIQEACRYFCQLVQAVKFLHSRNIVHRDIKPENIIVDGDRLKLIDFGLSTEWASAKTMMETPCGSPCYAAPEMVAGKKYDCRKVDIWAMGVTLYAMLMGKLPYQHENTLKLYKLIENSEFEQVKGVPSYVNILLKAMIEKDPKKRIKISEIEQNIWIQDSLKEYKSTISTNAQWNQSILKQMEIFFCKSSAYVFNELNKSSISGYATYYNLKAAKIKKQLSQSDLDLHDGPFHIQFVFKNSSCVQAFLDKHSIAYQWVEKGQSFSEIQGLNAQNFQDPEIKRKNRIKINGQVMIIKGLKHLPQLIYLPINHPNLKTENQFKKMPLVNQHIQRSHTNLDSSRSNMTTICVETF